MCRLLYVIAAGAAVAFGREVADASRRTILQMNAVQNRAASSGY